MSDSSLLARFPALRRLRLGPRRRIPFVQQMTAAECGAACLLMVLRWHGRSVPMKNLREVVGTSRYGVDANSLISAAQVYGLRGRGVRIEDIADISLLEPGAILHWKFNHFVVFERFGRRGIQVLDPALGRRRVPHREVERSFTGIAIALEPGAEFERRSDDESRGVWPYLRKLMRHNRLLTRVLVTSLAFQLLALTVPVLTGLLVDRIVPSNERRLLVVLAAGFLMLGGFQLLASLVRSFLLLHLRTRLDAQMTLEFLENLVALPFRFFQQRSTGDLLMRLNSNTTIREILTTSGISGLFDSLMVSVYLVILLFINVPLGLVVASLGLIRVGLFLVTRRRQRDLMSEALQVQAESRSYQVQMLTGIETLKASGAERRAVEHWSNLFVNELNVSLARGRLDAVVNGILASLDTISPLLVLLCGGWLVLDGQLTLGTMLALSAIAQGFLRPLSTLVNTAFQLQLMGSYLDRIYDVLDADRERVADRTGHPRPLHGRLTLDQVTFRYAPLTPPAVASVDLEVESGSLVGIVGGSGSGKSTLAALLAGLFEPDEGRILFDGRDLRELDLQWLRRQLGFVPQHPYLFSLSVRANIAMVDPTLPLHRVVEAARTAAIHDEIAALPMGFETLLADNGASLSGGQRQRIALARALVHRPRMLILDEATSALDAVTEQVVQQNLVQLRCTRIVIAHRLSTIRAADKILVMEQGRVVENGTHDQLLTLGGRYSALISAQMAERPRRTGPLEVAST